MAVCAIWQFPYSTNALSPRRAVDSRLPKIAARHTVTRLCEILDQLEYRNVRCRIGCQGERKGGDQVRSASGRGDHPAGDDGAGDDDRDGNARTRLHTTNNPRQCQRLRAASRSLPGRRLQPSWQPQVTLHRPHTSLS